MPRRRSATSNGRARAGARSPQALRGVASPSSRSADPTRPSVAISKRYGRASPPFRSLTWPGNVALLQACANLRRPRHLDHAISPPPPAARPWRCSGRSIRASGVPGRSAASMRRGRRAARSRIAATSGSCRIPLPCLPCTLGGLRTAYRQRQRLPARSWPPSRCWRPRMQALGKGR